MTTNTNPQENTMQENENIPTNADVPADTPDNIEMKHVVETSFFALVHEMEEHMTRGWRIHPDNPPSNNWILYEVWLYKDRNSINRTKNRIEEVLEARSEQSKEKASENIQKARVARKAKSEDRKSGPAVQEMLVSLKDPEHEDKV